MLGYDEKRNYIRMELDCGITYRLVDSNELFDGQCSTISGAGVSFFADQFIDPGKAMEINIVPQNSLTPPMTAFIEVIRSTEQNDGRYEIAGTIKSIKGD